MTAPPTIANTLLHDWDVGSIPSPVAGNPISSISDSAGTLAVTQGTAAAQPTLAQVTNGGKTFWTASFDGTDDFLQTVNETITPPLTVFAIAYVASTTVVNGLVTSDTGNNQPRIFQHRLNNTGVAQFIGFNTSGTPYTDSETDASGWSVTAGIFAATTVEMTFNGSTNGTTATTGTPQSASAPWALGLATYNPQTGFLSGKIARVIVYSGAVSPIDRAKIDSWVQDTYGITVSDYVSSASGSLTLSGSVNNGGSTATGSVTLSGSATASVGPVTGSLALSGSAVSSVGPVTGTLALAGSATAQAQGTASGSLSLGGTATGSFTATGSLSLSGTATAGSSTTAAGSLSLTGTATAGTRATATGSLALSGGVSNTTTATGAVSLTGTGTAASTGTASGSLTLSGTGVTSFAAAGALSLAGIAQAQATLTALGVLTLSGTASAHGPGNYATGSITLTGTATAIADTSTYRIKVGPPRTTWRIGPPEQRWRIGPPRTVWRIGG